MTEKTVRWGILGAAEIARKNWQAIAKSGNSQLVAVASRDAQRAQEFINVCGSHTPIEPKPEALDSYLSLLTRSDIDAVYIPLPTGVRKEWVLKAAAAGKHVLCEKPCAPTSADLKEMIAACEKAGVLFIDGVMFMHSLRLAEMKKVLSDGATIGSIRRITSQFSFRAGGDFQAKNIRAASNLEPLGCLGDLGWYNVRFSLWAMNYALPVEVRGRLIAPSLDDVKRGKATPMEFSGEMLFEGGATASFYCSFVSENQQWAVVSGERGYLSVRDFVLPFHGAETRFETNAPSFEVDRCDFNMHDRTQERTLAEPSNSAADSQETNMIREFSRIVQSDAIDSQWAKIALATQQTIDALMDSALAGGEGRDPRTLA
jgi:predicted dehydrogenase